MSVTTPTPGPAPTAATPPPTGGTTAGSLPPLSDDVAAFCERHGLVPHLEATARLLRESFPPPGDVSVHLFTDPESDEAASWVVVKVRSLGSVPALLQANERFLDRWIPVTPAAVRDLLNTSFTPA